MSHIDFREKLEQCKDYGDLFDLVKLSVKKVLKANRAGLMLYLEDLPLRVGAFHQIGSNGIVLNRRLVDAVANSTKSVTELKSFIFSLLLHEYLHSLGFLNEQDVRKLVREIILDVFGADHPAVQMALQLPLPNMLLETHIEDRKKGLELIKNFEKPRHQYII
ncbi:MAG: hypothetical protein QXX08_04880 [Candidatus Bathyarchaeia archaeon]